MITYDHEKQSASMEKTLSNNVALFEMNQGWKDLTPNLITLPYLKIASGLTS